jgi:hypothetical protein
MLLSTLPSDSKIQVWIFYKSKTSILETESNWWRRDQSSLPFDLMQQQKSAWGGLVLMLVSYILGNHFIFMIMQVTSSTILQETLEHLWMNFRKRKY